jgi:glutaredoxin-like YruB-family protein
MDAIMYSTPSCTYCREAKQYLNDKGVSVKDIDISKNQKAAEEMLELTGQSGVPVIILKESTIIGFDLVKINQLLNT